MPRKNRKKSSSDGRTDLRTMIIKALIGSLISVIVFFLLTVLMSLIGWKNDMTSGIFKYMEIGAAAVSGFIGGFVAVRPVRKNGLVVGALSAFPAFLIIVLVATTVSYSGINMYGWLLLGAMILFSAFGGILAANKRK